VLTFPDVCSKARSHLVRNLLEHPTGRLFADSPEKFRSTEQCPRHSQWARVTAGTSLASQLRQPAFNPETGYLLTTVPEENAKCRVLVATTCATLRLVNCNGRFDYASAPSNARRSLDCSTV